MEEAQGATGGVLRAGRGSPHLLLILINIDSIRSVPHATELNGSTVHCMVAGHNHEPAAVPSRGVADLGVQPCSSAGWVSRRGEAEGVAVAAATAAEVDTTANGACGGGSGSRSRCIGNLFRVRLGQISLGGLTVVVDGRDDRMGGLGDGCLLGR